MFDLIDGQLDYSVTFRLGEEIVLVCGNEPLTALDVMSEKVICKIQDEYDFKVILFKCSVDSKIFRASLQHRDRTARNEYFNKGYYVCNHFGKRMNVITKKNEMYVFGEDFSRLFWSYIIKYLMQIYALNNEALFVKCSAFAIDNQCTVLLGCGGSGKTTINLQVCASGAQFITNSNAYIREGKIMGIGSKMRVRANGVCNIKEVNYYLESGLDNKEFLVDPLVSFNSNIENWIPIKNIIITNYTDGKKKINKIDCQLACAYAQQFLLGMNVYRLEEDILEYYGNDITLFSREYLNMISRLEKLFTECRCFTADIDVFDGEMLSQFMEVL